MIVPEPDSSDEALAALHAFSDSHAAIVEMRFTLGLTVEETARQTGIPERTVKRRWSAAKLFLLREMAGGAAPPPEP